MKTPIASNRKKRKDEEGASLKRKRFAVNVVQKGIYTIYTIQF